MVLKTFNISLEYDLVPFRLRLPIRWNLSTKQISLKSHWSGILCAKSTTRRQFTWGATFVSYLKVISILICVIVSQYNSTTFPEAAQAGKNVSSFALLQNNIFEYLSIGRSWFAAADWFRCWWRKLWAANAETGVLMPSELFRCCREMAGVLLFALRFGWSMWIGRGLSWPGAAVTHRPSRRNQAC